ncbi:MAG TPA: hypothetical protein ENN29_09765 [Candidatus Hydrogenedentes bacterium]|nr:hypothetical protein [Candidatus Hydrogenedentota bacterium]
MSRHERKGKKHQKQVGVMYSYGPHFLKAVESAANNFPDATITALVPTNYPAERLTSYGAQIRCCVPEPGAARSVGAVIRTLCAVRRGKYDVFVVLFPSVKLRVLAAASGAARRYCFGLDNNLAELKGNPMRILCEQVARRIKGQLLYWKIWMHIRLTPISESKEEAGTPEKDAKGKGTANER